MGLQLFIALLAFFLLNKSSIFSQELVEGFSNLREVFDESSVEAGMTQELPNYFYICWRWQLGDEFNFCFVDFYSPTGNNVSQYDSLVNHKMALLPVEHQVLLYAPPQDGLQISQTFFIISSIDSDIIHVYFHYAFHHIAEHAKHTSLESSRGVAKAKMHPLVRIGAKWTSKGSLFLIL